MSRRVPFWVVMLMTPLLALAGCADSSGGGSSQSRKDKLSRDVDEQVDAVMKDFKNE